MTAIKQELNDYGNTPINQIIMGIQPIEAFDEMVEYFKAHGASEMEEIYNEAEAAYQASLAE